MYEELLATSIYALITTVTTIISVVKNFKQKATNEKIRTINKYAQVLQKLPNWISEVENEVQGEKQGKLKKTMVIQRIQLDCAEKGIPYDTSFHNEIEKILETPQKELENEEKNESN